MICSVAAGLGFIDRLGGRRRRRDRAGSRSGGGRGGGRVDADGLHHRRRLGSDDSIVAASVAATAWGAAARSIRDGRRRLVDHDDRRRRVTLVIHELELHLTLGDMPLRQRIRKPVHRVRPRKKQEQAGDAESKRQSRGTVSTEDFEHGESPIRISVRGGLEGFDRMRPFERTKVYITFRKFCQGIALQKAKAGLNLAIC